MARPSIALFLATAGLIAGATGCGQSANAPAPKGGETVAPSTAAPAAAPVKPEAEKSEKPEKAGEGGEGGEGGEN